MTENDAKGKLCPFMTYCVNENAVIQNGHHPIYAQARCQGSECMSWDTAPRASFTSMGHRIEHVGYCRRLGKPGP
jgi:hypothetical protein